MTCYSTTIPQISKETKILSPTERHPSFETILSFVRNTGLTVANVETLLQERAELARKMSDGFSFAAEYLRVMSSETTPPEVLPHPHVFKRFIDI